MGENLNIISTAILLTFILDPFGNVPLLLTILKDVDKASHRKIIIREMLIGLFILIVFLFAGKSFLTVFHLQTNSVRIAGGVIFLIISLRLIFPAANGTNIFSANSEPFIVPIAMPMVAGPSALATLLVLSNQHTEQMPQLFASLLIAWSITATTLLLSPFLFRLLRKKGLIAMEKLMGMLLLMMAVQMILDGFRDYVNSF